MENENGKKEAPVPATQTLTSQAGGMFLDATRFEFGKRVALMLADSTMIPEHFRKNPGNVMIALNLAERFGADPFMVMQNVYVVQGKPGLESKLAIALINDSGKFTPLQFKLEGEGDTRKSTAHATHKETKEHLEQVVTMKMAIDEGWVSKAGSKWKTMPDLMLQYRSAMFFARLFCPEVLLGMQTREELTDSIDVTPAKNGVYKTEDPEPQKFDTSKFDELVEKGFGADDLPLETLVNLNKFVKITAEANDTSIDEFKVVAADNFDGFWNAFNEWRDGQPPDKDPEMLDCPHCTTFSTKSARGLKKHITQQHPEPPPEETDIDPEAEKAAVIVDLQRHKLATERAREALSISETYALEDMPIDLLNTILDRVKAAELKGVGAGG